MIHVQEPHGYSPHWRQADNLTAGHRKVVSPCVGTRVKQVYLVAGLRIDAREIRAFEGVTSVTGVSQPRWIVVILIDVLFGNDVFDVVRNERRCLLRKMTVFAPTDRPLAILQSHESLRSCQAE